MADGPVVVRCNGEIVYLQNMDPATDAIYIPPNRDLIDVRCFAVPLAAVIAVLACLILTVIIVHQNDWWIDEQCDYADCKINADDISGDRVNVQLTLIRGETRQPVTISALANKAPYICQKTTGHCYATARKHTGRADSDSKLSFVKIYRWPTSAMIIMNVVLFTATTSFCYLLIVGIVYACAMNNAITKAIAVPKVATVTPLLDAAAKSK